ncbi:MAG TPA: 4Fe-4S dicluster domain-containing protein [Dehalococcoidia bacterium]|jgi:ferredoxin|nr:4Fe-4S dicluster domain-containing protein [Dehalococcoidia bacterium]
MPYVADYKVERCLDCGSCRQLVPCPGREEGCIGCGACALACPNEAIEMVEEPREKKVCLDLDGQEAHVPERISLREALELLGYPVARGPGEEGIFALPNLPDLRPLRLDPLFRHEDAIGKVIGQQLVKRA